MQNYLDAKHPFICVDSDGDNSGNESNGSADDGFFLEKTNCNFNRAEEEFNNFESFKRNRYHQKWFGTSQRFSLVWGRKVNWKKYCGAITEK
jgi:hypothetical protein